MDDLAKQMRKAQKKLEAAERREDWVTVLLWDEEIDRLSLKAANERAARA